MNEDIFVKFALGILASITMFFVAMMVKLWNSHNAHKLHVAETYMKKDTMVIFDTKLNNLAQKLEDLLKAVYKIEARAEAQESAKLKNS